MEIAASAAPIARFGPSACHHRTDVGEVEVDQAGLDHKVGHAAHAAIQHLVGHVEGVREGRLLIGDAEQILVRDDDQRIDKLLKLLDAGFGDPHAMQALEVEGLRHHAHGQDALLAGGGSNHRCRPGARPAAHAGGDEHHVGALKLTNDLVQRLLGSPAADIGTRSCAQSRSQVRAQLDPPLAERLRECLGIGIGDDEIDAFQVLLDHVVDGIAAGAADAHDGNLGLQLERCVRHGEVQGHRILRCKTTVMLQPVNAGNVFARFPASRACRCLVIKNSPAASFRVGRSGRSMRRRTPGPRVAARPRPCGRR